MKKFLIVSMLMLIAVLTFAGAQKEDAGGAVEGTEAELPLLEYTIFYPGGDPQKLASVPNDVVTPWIEKKFNIKVERIIPQTEQSGEEMLAQWIAADNLPDVFRGASGQVAPVIANDIVAPLDDYLPDKMPNLAKYFDESYWPWYQNDGHYYQIPSVFVNRYKEDYEDDPYSMGTPNWCMWVREDILAMAGYEFEPLDEIAARTTEKGIKPNVSVNPLDPGDFKITPAIDTPEAYYEFLKKVKALDLKVEGKTVYPISVQGWMLWHLGAMFDWGYWQKYPDGTISAMFENRGAKDYFKFIKKLVDEELMDPDFLIQKDYSDKFATGRIASGMMAWDGDIAALKQANPEARIRYIPWPKEKLGYGFYDIFTPGFHRFVINKDFEDIGRLIEYFDWFYTDEGLNVTSWGPEEAGLWEIKDGKKVFKDPEVEHDCLNNVLGGKGADYWGLADPVGRTYWSTAAMCAPSLLMSINPFHYKRSYPTKPDILAINKNYLGFEGKDYFYHRASYGDNGPNTATAQGYFWGDFVNKDIVSLLEAKNDAEFDDAWENVVLKHYYEKGKYAQAVEDMKVWYEQVGWGE